MLRTTSLLGFFLLFAACSSSPEEGTSGAQSANPNDPDASQTPAQTDEGCGGSESPACEDGRRCRVGRDCVSRSCANGVCAMATAGDGIANGDETDVDCGGSAAKACDDGRGCRQNDDCESLSCEGGTCVPSTRTDGLKNGDETDVDCGGSAAPCATGKACAKGADCESLVCGGGTCKAPTATDGVKNADESDVDCGGTVTKAPKCGAGLSCKEHDDCASDGCGYAGKCVDGRSCTRHLGGDTCGAGEVGDPAAKHASCCETAAVPNSKVRVDKFEVTAGRMRAFIERTGGNVKATVSGVPGWKAAWTALVPGTLEEANTMLGPYWTGAPNDTDRTSSSKRSCAAGSFGGHTYFTPGDAAQDFTQDELDPKALNCVGWHLMRAFCAWEGGRLPTAAEIKSAFTNGTNAGLPWSWRDTSPYDAAKMDPRLNHKFNYGFPAKSTRRFNGETPADVAWYVSPPGRFPLGANKEGVQISGNVLPWLSEEYSFSWTFSWESHKGDASVSTWSKSFPPEPNGYYAIGGRCAYDP